MDPKIRTQGVVRVRSIATKHGDGSLETPESITHDRERHRALPRFLGPCGEVKPLLHAFLYYDATPREDYTALVTEL
jgi:hypothetical protein